MTAMGGVLGVLGIEGGTMLSIGEDLSGNDMMSKDSDNDDNGSSGGGVRDKRGNIVKQWRRFERQQRDDQG
jgi:hypothetical protein